MDNNGSNGPRTEVEVCVVGGGPAGMLLAVLLARRGISVRVLERHHDFAREYRGEVLMPRFTKLLRRLALFHVLEREIHRKPAGIVFGDHTAHFPVHDGQQMVNVPLLHAGVGPLEVDFDACRVPVAMPYVEHAPSNFEEIHIE